MMGWAYHVHVKALYEHTGLLPQQKKQFCTRHLLTRKPATRKMKYHKDIPQIRSNSLPLAVMKLACSVFAYKEQSQPVLFMLYQGYMHCAKHMNDIYAAEIYSQSQICLCGRDGYGSIKFQVLQLQIVHYTGLILPAMNLNCLDNNFVLLLYRVPVSGSLGLSSLRISAKSADKQSSLQEQDKGSRSSFFVIRAPVRSSDRLVATES